MNFTEGDERLGWLVNVSSVSGPNTRYDRSRGIGAALKDENASIHTRYARRYPPARSPFRAPIQNLSKAWHPALPVFQNSAKLNFQTLPIPPIQTTVQEAETGKSSAPSTATSCSRTATRSRLGSGTRLLPHRHQTRLRARRRGVSPPPVRGQDPRRYRARQGGPGPQEPPERTEAEVPQGDVRDGAGPDGRPPRGAADGERTSPGRAAEAYEALHQMEASAVTHQGRAHHGVSRGGGRSPPRVRGPSRTTRTP